MKFKCIWFVHQGPIEKTDNALTERTGIQSVHCLNCDTYWDDI